MQGEGVGSSQESRKRRGQRFILPEFGQNAKNCSTSPLPPPLFLLDPKGYANFAHLRNPCTPLDFLIDVP